MDNELHNELTRLLGEVNRVRRTNRPTNNRTARNTNISDTIFLLQELLYLYNTNMFEYQDNMRTIIEVIRILIENSNYTATNEGANSIRTTPIINPTPNTNRNIGSINNPIMQSRSSIDLNSLIYYAIYQNNTIAREPAGFQNNVIVSPTLQQIQGATTSYLYNQDGNGTENYITCPITQEEFQDGEQVCRIINCGHTFKKTAIMQWFETSVRCPVCRYDIREHSNNESAMPTATQTPPTTPSNTEPNNTTATNLHSRVMNSLIDIVNQYYLEGDADISNNLIYTFDIPIYTVDISNIAMRR